MSVGGVVGNVATDVVVNLVGNLGWMEPQNNHGGPGSNPGSKEVLVRLQPVRHGSLVNY